jgi:large subunit ribosomal protein L14e
MTTGSGAVKKYVEKTDIVAKWDASSWAKKRASVSKRRTLGDFERYVPFDLSSSPHLTFGLSFSVLVYKKQRRDAVRKSLAKAKKSA